MVVIHTHAKDRGQRSVGSKDRMETGGRMEAIVYTSHTNARSVIR